MKTGLLDVIGLLEGTDKSSLHNGYLHAYESLFHEFRDESFDLIEIGIFRGSSLALWQEYFPKARIIGVDIEPSCKRFEGGRVIVEIGSQADPEFLAQLLRKYRPLIIIDDGSHLAPHIQIAFEHLFPGLLPGGYYVVEDTYMHFGPSAAKHRADAAVPLADYFTALALNKMSQFVETTGNAAFKHYCFHNSESINFMRSTIAIRKKPIAEYGPECIAMAEEVAETRRSAPSWHGAAGVMLAVRGPLDRAEIMIRNAIAEVPEEPEYHRRLSEVLDAAGRTREAAVAMAQAARIAPLHPYYWDNLARLYARLGDDALAVDTMQRAIDIHPTNPHYFRFQSDALMRLGRIPDAVRQLTAAIRLGDGTPMVQEWTPLLRELQNAMKSSQ
ncbi:MAG TPA: tetratricopeptide repeat protein [Acetobacteraceae bacterium]|nr:tetratricopeptide repeat protein [Acetobacteraceae bacterium]